MRSSFSHFGSLEFFFEIAAVAGVFGLVVGTLGLILNFKLLMIVGACFAAPMLLGVLAIVFVLIPILVVANIRARR